MIYNEDFVLINDNNRFLHKDNKTSTDNLRNARTYKTWQGANKRAEGTNYKYILVEELFQKIHVDKPEIAARRNY